MASMNRGTSILLHALHQFEQAAEDASLDAEAKAMTGLGSFDSINVIARKWHRKYDRGDKKRLADFAELRGWQTRWLAAARRVDHAALRPGVEQFEKDLRVEIRDDS
ncbi:MAG: hypothetical protein AAGI46_08275 [Planctomycetota bacterium]